MLGLMGRAIQGAVGTKYIYWLFGLGSLFGGCTSTFFKPPGPYIQPQIGAEGAIAAYLTFITLMNPQQTFLFFVFPIRAWMLVCFLGAYSLFFDPHKRSFAGITAGLTVYNMRKVNFLWTWVIDIQLCLIFTSIKEIKLSDHVLMSSFSSSIFFSSTIEFS